jgi:hypothetical protein
MRYHFLKLVGIFAVLVAVFLLSPNLAAASTAHNVRGIAYNAANGYILFNCLDDDFAGRFTFTFSFYFYIIPCSVDNFGVNIDANNNFSGNAWNEHLGYITFESTSTPPNLDFRDNGRCNYTRADGSTNVCDSSNHCTACFNEKDNKAYGYMQVVGTQEWIRLDSINPAILDADKLKINGYLVSNPGIFSGSTDASFGEISFRGSISGFDYGVKMWPLEIRQLTAPNWSSIDACSSGANRATLRWALRSGEQAAYQIVISTENSTSTGVVTSQIVNGLNGSIPQFNANALDYDTHYYWFLKLWDTQGSSTPWRQFNTQGSTASTISKLGNKDWLTDNYNRNLTSPYPNLTFTSYRHSFPIADFTARSLVGNPDEFLIATSSNSFVSSSTRFAYYDGDNHEQVCDDAHCDYQWTSDDGPAQILASTSASTSILFTKVASTKVELKVMDKTDGEGDVYQCSFPRYLNVNYALPIWKETKAPSAN